MILCNFHLKLIVPGLIDYNLKKKIVHLDLGNGGLQSSAAHY